MAHPDRVRKLYLCPLCETSTLQGEHMQEREMKGGRIEIVCRVPMICHYPAKRGIIRSIGDNGTTRVVRE